MLVLLYSIAGALALAALAIATWALFADRSRGRRRCPKCFHTMDPAIGLVCPECGRDVRDEQRLFKTRRRWKLAILVVVVLGTPAALTGGLARVKQTGGWSDLPSWVVVRLMWIEDERLDDEILACVGRGDISRSQAKVIVREARHRIASPDPNLVDGGLALLEKLGRNDIGYYPNFASERPRLEELEPDLLGAALADLAERDPARLGRVAELLGHLRDVNDEVVVWLVDRLCDEQLVFRPSVSRGLFATMRGGTDGFTDRIPKPPGVLEAGTFGSRLRGGPQPAHVAANLAQGVRRAGVGVESARIWAQSAWQASVGDPTAWDAEQLPALWLWARLDHYGAASRPAVFAATDNGEEIVERYAVSLLAGYEWSEDMAEIIRRKLETGDEETASLALDVARSFGAQAESVLPAITERVTSIEGLVVSNDFIGAYQQIGGTESALRDALVRRLERVYEERLEEVMRDMRPPTRLPLIVEYDLTRLAYISVPDERAAAVCMKYTTVGKNSPSEWAAIAYGAMSGDRAWATKFLLDRAPKLSGGLVDGTTAASVLELVRTGRADTEMLSGHFLAGDRVERAAFTDLLHQFIYDWRILETFLPFLREVAGDATAPGERAAAQLTLDRYERYKSLDRDR